MQIYNESNIYGELANKEKEKAERDCHNLNTRSVSTVWVLTLTILHLSANLLILCVTEHIE